ncbi:uncharacterized protein LOC120358283 [Solenopsis invicta]|uniref:uncharacterized protein LOC120358283 n=1 Tax=Solenopsis invicta TaxID=13686 RepID=UPI00193D5E49|nr:uncharacterized protein LOC120358283 [Solenopsis invicta]
MLLVKQCFEWFKKFKSGDFDVRNKERGKPPKKFADNKLQALLDKDNTQTQQKLADQLNVMQKAVFVRLKAMGKIQKEVDLGAGRCIGQISTKATLLRAFEKVTLKDKVSVSNTGDSAERRQWNDGDQYRRPDEKTKSEKKEAASNETERRCFNCDQREYTAADCPTKAQGAKCFQCGERGHIAAKCTKKQNVVQSVEVTTTKENNMINQIISRIWGIVPITLIVVLALLCLLLIIHVVRSRFRGRLSSEASYALYPQQYYKSVPVYDMLMHRNKKIILLQKTVDPQRERDKQCAKANFQFAKTLLYTIADEISQNLRNNCDSATSMSKLLNGSL